MPVPWALLGSMLLLAWTLWRVFGGYAPAGAGTRVLARRELALLAAAADATYPAGGPVAPSGQQAGVPQYADRYVSAVPAGTRRLMRMLFFLVEHATLFFPARGRGGFRRFSSLNRDQQEAVLDAWRTSAWFPRRLVFSSLRAILTMGYFGCPEVQRSLGLAPKAIRSPIVEADLLYPAIGASRDSIAHRVEDLEAPGVPPLGPDAPLHPGTAEPFA